MTLTGGQYDAMTAAKLRNNITNATSARPPQRVLSFVVRIVGKELPLITLITLSLNSIQAIFISRLESEAFSECSGGRVLRVAVPRRFAIEAQTFLDK
jgi:hypothetical protein